MLRISSSSSSSDLPSVNPRDLLDLPDEVIANIVARIPSSDNATLSHLVTSCTHLWRIAGIDALLSFFHAASQAYASGDTNKKVAVFRALSEWLPKVADQLPDEQRVQLLERLMNIDPLRSASVADNLTMVNALNRLIVMARQEIDRLLEACGEDPVALSQIQADLLRIDKISSRGITTLSHYYEQLILTGSQRPNEHMMRLMQMPT